MLRLLLFAVVLCGLECVVAAAEPVIGQHDPGVPELAVLERFAGRWEAQLANSDELIHGTRVWVLSGRFLQHDYTLSSGNLSGTLYRGYDQKNSCYTLLMLDSKGTASMLTGYWSEDQRTLSFEAVDSSCLVQKYESYFPDETTEKWSLTIQGDGLVELSGTAKRQSPTQ